MSTARDVSLITGLPVVDPASYEVDDDDDGGSSMTSSGSVAEASSRFGSADIPSSTVSGEASSSFFDSFTPGSRRSSSTSASQANVVIVGAGPAGLFAALELVEAGVKPVIVERGM